jgi:hypothetical protein
MSTNNDQYRALIQLLLPKEIFDYFNLQKLEVTGNEIHAYLDEENIVPESYEEEKLISKGFHSSITIQDFPIRDKLMFLHVRRRRWQVESTGKVVSRDWDTVAKGTRLTKDFATFLKGILG